VALRAKRKVSRRALRVAVSGSVVDVCVSDHLPNDCVAREMAVGFYTKPLNGNHRSISLFAFWSAVELEFASRIVCNRVRHTYLFILHFPANGENVCRYCLECAHGTDY